MKGKVNTIRLLVRRYSLYKKYLHREVFEHLILHTVFDGEWASYI